MDTNQKSGGGFMSGFVWGAIIGGGIVYLLSTKKGKKILKAITEGGLEGVEELEDIIASVAEEKEYEAAPRPKKQKSNPKQEIIMEEMPVRSEEPVNSQSTISKIKSSSRRFFKGVPRR